MASLVESRKRVCGPISPSARQAHASVTGPDILISALVTLDFQLATPIIRLHPDFWAGEGGGTL
jgi:hypothetical protein